MIEVKTVDKNHRIVVFNTNAGSVMVKDNKIVEQMGFVEPAELKKIFKTYNAIIKSC